MVPITTTEMSTKINVSARRESATTGKGVVDGGGTAAGGRETALGGTGAILRWRRTGDA